MGFVHIQNFKSVCRLQLFTHESAAGMQADEGFKDLIYYLLEWTPSTRSSTACYLCVDFKTYSCPSRGEGMPPW